MSQNTNIRLVPGEHATGSKESRSRYSEVGDPDPQSAN